MFELVNEAKAIELRLSEADGELTEQTELEIYKNELSLKDKTDACAAYREHLESELTKWDSRVKEAQACKKRAELKLKRFEDYLIFNLKEIGGKITGHYSELSIKETSGNLVITSQDQIPESYKKEVITKEVIIDNKSLKEDLKLGVPVSGAEIKLNYSLKIKPI